MGLLPAAAAKLTEPEPAKEYIEYQLRRKGIPIIKVSPGDLFLITCDPVSVAAQ